MKTFFAVFNKEKIQPREIKNYKQYVFNTYDDIVVGDLLKTDYLKTTLQVTDVCTDIFSHYDPETNNLHETLRNTKHFPIKLINVLSKKHIGEVENEIIVGRD